MKINQNIPLFFQKKLFANCSILNNGKEEKCHIYQLDKQEDKGYFDPLFKNRDWQGHQLLELIDGEFKFCSKIPQEHYVIETKKGKCLGFAEIDIEKDKDSLIFIETMPKASSWKTNRQRKYIGETLLSFLVQKTKKANKKFIICNPTSDAKPFYINKCLFKEQPNGSLEIKSEDVEAFIKANSEHTSNKIEFVV